MFQVCNMNVCFRVSVSVSVCLSVCLSLAVYFVLAFLSPKTLFSLQYNYNSLLFIDSSAVSRTFCLLFILFFITGHYFLKFLVPLAFVSYKVRVSVLFYFLVFLRGNPVAPEIHCTVCVSRVPPVLPMWLCDKLVYARWLLMHRLGEEGRVSRGSRRHPHG